MKKRIVIFTGSGVSAESGIRTFRDSGGLWEEHRIEDVATPEAWHRNQELVLNFYNQRRKQVIEAKPNKAHLAIASLEKKFEVIVITQNVDDLHERAGSKNVLHLHGEIRKSRSTIDPKLIYEIKGADLNTGDKCEKNSQLRPHIVWFGELVPEMSKAESIASRADIFIAIGTSLNVYPAANLVHSAPEGIAKYFIDPAADTISSALDFKIIKKNAAKGVPELTKILLNLPES